MHRAKSHSIVVLADVGGADFHVGDEAMLAANLGWIREADEGVEITVLGRDADADAIEQAVADCDGAMISGGGNLADTWPALLEQRITFLDAASRHDRPVVVGGQTLGPELSEPARSELARALSTAELVGLRERPSLELARDLGLDEARLVFQTDDAFALQGSAPDDASVLRATADPYLAVTLDESFGVPAARESVRALAQQLAAAAAEFDLGIICLPHVGRAGTHAGGDSAAANELARQVRLLGTTATIAPVPTVEQAVWLSQHAALTVSTRYHPLVFATATGGAAVGIYRDAYTGVKLAGALDHVGQSDRCLALGDAEAGALLPLLRREWVSSDRRGGVWHDASAQIARHERARRAAFLAHLGLGVQPVGDAPNSSLPKRMQAAATIDHVSVTESTPATSTSSAGSPPDTNGPRADEVSRDLTLEQWDAFARDGFLHLGQVLDGDAVARLTARADDLAMGRLQNEHIQMQLDTGGAYEDLPEAVDAFGEGTRLYRKIQGLEMDDEFISLVRHPRFFEVCARMYGPHVPISIFRAMIMNKPAGQGTVLPWHQDGGDVWALDREPLVTIWIALDAATTSNGCMEAVRGSHRLGLLSNYGSTLSAEHAAAHCPADQTVALEVPAGHAVLMHNWLIHRSGVNPSPVPRRAVTICYLDGRTRSVQTGDLLPVVAGHVDHEPHPYVAALLAERALLRESRDRSEEYARSLATTLEDVQRARQEAESYAQSLQAERERHERERLEAERLIAGD